MPYVGAFSNYTENVLVPYVLEIKTHLAVICRALEGKDTAGASGADVSFAVYPLPKIALHYIFYEADDEFPSSAACLYSSNAQKFMPVDGLADVGEYCSKKILELIRL